jgi:hypothetical protein
VHRIVLAGSDYFSELFDVQSATSHQLPLTTQQVSNVVMAYYSGEMWQHAGTAARASRRASEVAKR